MDSILQFFGQQSILISAIIVVIALIAQEALSENKGSKYSIDPETAAVMLFRGVKIFDIREKASFKESHIEHAKWQNAKQLEINPEKYISPKKQYIFYCGNGNQSGELARTLRNKAGYQTYYIEEGLEAWKRAKLTLINTGSN